MQSVSSLFAQFSVFGFSGSRSAVPQPLRLIAALVPPSAAVFVGCASGVDAFIRSHFPAHRLFSVASFGVGRAAFARRSAACVSATAAAGGLWVSFPSQLCPMSVVPSASPSACFSGSGSGSWASLAFAVGSCVPCLVVLPVGVVPPVWVSSRFRSLGAGVWYLVGAAQPSLF